MTSTKSEKSGQHTSNVTTRLFVGYQISPEVRVQLNNSPSWKQNQAVRSKEPHSLREVPHNEKDYIGIFVHKEKPTLDDLQKIKTIISEELEKYCTTLRIPPKKIIIFPQIFLS